MKAPAERFWSRVNKAGPIPEYAPHLGACWIWEGTPKGDGYGVFYVRNEPGLRTRAAHRMAYEYVRGPIEEGLQIDHLCRVPVCVNPDHMEAVTSRTNTLRGNTIPAANARKTHCLRGHPFDGENTRYEICPNGRVARKCRVCNRLRWHVNEQKKNGGDATENYRPKARGRGTLGAPASHSFTERIARWKT